MPKRVTVQDGERTFPMYLQRQFGIDGGRVLFLATRKEDGRGYAMVVRYGFDCYVPAN